MYAGLENILMCEGLRPIWRCARTGTRPESEVRNLQIGTLGRMTGRNLGVMLSAATDCTNRSTTDSELVALAPTRSFTAFNDRDWLLSFSALALPTSSSPQTEAGMIWDCWPKTRPLSATVTQLGNGMRGVPSIV